MMNYEEFKDAIVSRIGEYLPEELNDLEITIKATDKINTTSDMIIFKGKSNVAPTLSLNEMYESYMSDTDIERVLVHLSARVQNGFDEAPEIEMSDIFDNAKNKIVFQLINTEKNKKLLNNVPHRKFLDLSIIYRIEVDNCGIKGSILVRNALAAKLGLSEEELHKLAWENTKAITPPTIMSMHEMIKELSGIDIPDEKSKTWQVISNSDKHNGATYMMYDEVLSEVADKIGTDIYILPSSIHEFIAVPVDELDKEDLSEMVTDVNGNVLEERLILSDTVYRYNRETKELSIA